MNLSQSCESTQLEVLTPENGNLTDIVKIDDDSDKFLSSVSIQKKRTYSKWSPMEEGVTLAWRDLNIYVQCRKNGKNGYKRIINNVTGAVKAGSLVALMGASGSGKSTLMAALAFRNSGSIVIEGDILVNGRPVGDYMRYLSGFMHQDDLFVGALTVWEHMNVMAHLKLDRRITNYDRNYKIQELLKHLGLTECINTRIGINGEEKVLSGGEKKRLAFATELLTDPQLLFCDEPTTGLDSYSAQKIVTMMNLMASCGKTIVCIIHQPSSEIFAMFSQLLLLADCRIAYMGSTANAIEFFSKLDYQCPYNYNPADFFIKTLAMTPGAEEASKQTVKKICDHFAVSDYVKEVNVVVQYEFHMGRASETRSFDFRNNFKETFCWSKLYWLIYRSLLTILRDTSLQIVRIVQKMAIALVIGLCYIGTTEKNQNGIQSVQGALFIFVAENTFNPMYSALAAFPLDKALFLREYRSGLYSTGSYYVAKVAAMLPGLTIESVLFTLISYWLIGLKASLNTFLLTALIITLTINVATACGIFFSNAFESIPNAMTCLVPFDFVLMITSGIFLKLSSLPNYVAWIKYLSWILYSTESLTILQWEGVHNITCENPNPDLPCLTEGSEVLEKYSFSPENLNHDLWNMFFLCAIFHVLGFLCLWRKTKKK